MHAQEFVFDNGGYGQIIEDFHKGIVGLDIWVFMQTFVIKPIILGGGPALVVSAK